MNETTSATAVEVMVPEQRLAALEAAGERGTPDADAPTLTQVVDLALFDRPRSGASDPGEWLPPLFDLPPAVPAADAGMNGPASADLRESLGSARPAARPVNPVILALVVALRDVEQRRSRGNVLIHVTAKRPAA